MVVDEMIVDEMLVDEMAVDETAGHLSKHTQEMLMTRTSKAHTRDQDKQHSCRPHLFVSSDGSAEVQEMEQRLVR